LAAQHCLGSGREPSEIDRATHRDVPCAVWVQHVARPANGGVRREGRQQASGRGIEGDRFEVAHAVEDLLGAEKGVQRLALHLYLGRSVGRRAIQRWSQGRHVDLYPRQLRSQVADAKAVALGHRLHRRAGDVEIVGCPPARSPPRRLAGW
jgi:hypothetical protein